MATTHLVVYVLCDIEDVRGFKKANIEDYPISIPLSTEDPPWEDEELKIFCEDFWIRDQLKNYGAGPEGEHPRIAIYKIMRKERV